ncbi:MAG: septum formation initiator family protein [Actinomycetales bacterium]|nr:septum formation initiator family protein [Actinomycetales bacterium]
MTTSRSTRPTGSARRPGAAASRPGATTRHTGPGARAGARRPAPAARPREATADTAPGTVWWRWVVLAGLVIVLLVTLVPTARNLARQNAEIDALRDKIVSQQQQLADLKAEEERWGDPAYVEQQARARLQVRQAGRSLLHRHRRDGAEVPDAVGLRGRSAGRRLGTVVRPALAVGATGRSTGCLCHWPLTWHWSAVAHMPAALTA